MRVIIGTRGSKLALWQAEWVARYLIALHPGLEVELNKIKTTGDKILDVPLAKVGGKGLFVKEIEEALIRGEADIAVHSMKDVPTEFPEGLHLAVICRREDPRDAFVSPLNGRTFATPRFVDLKAGATVGTSSLRRSCQILHRRPDIKVVPLRGNLDTRLRKLDEGHFDAIILAAAGVRRLGWDRRITELLDPGVSLPAIGQGAIGSECRTDDERVHRLIAPLDHPETRSCVTAERAFLARLQGGCQVPIAAYARFQDSTERLVMDGLVGSVSGERIVRSRTEGMASEAEEIGTALADEILDSGGRAILEEVYGEKFTP